MRGSINVALMGSGGGTTIAEVIKAEVPGARIALVISSNPQGGLMSKALALGIPQSNIVVIDRSDAHYRSSEAFGEAICALFASRDIYSPAYPCPVR